MASLQQMRTIFVGNFKKTHTAFPFRDEVRATFKVRTRRAKRCLYSIVSRHPFRDVKPANLCLGTFENHTNRRVFLVDYNMARTYLDTENNPFPERCRVGFRGTPRYASRTAHRRKEMGPKDDGWSLVYSLLDLVVGSLPWTGLKGKKRIYQAKCKPMELKTGLEPIAEIMRHLDTKNRTDALDYNWLKTTLQRCAPAWGPDSRYDWQR